MSQQYSPSINESPVLDDPQYSPDEEQPLSPVAQRRAAKKQRKRDQRKQRRASRSHSVLIRRGIAVALMLGILLGLYYLLFHTTVAQPVLSMLGPVQEWLAWVQEKPSRLFTAAALLILPYMGTYSFLFERR